MEQGPTDTNECPPSEPTQTGIEAAFSEFFNDTDIFLFSGTLSRSAANELVDLVEEERSSSKVALILTTDGGDADAAYLIARRLRNYYENFTIYVFGRCKSAGTILVLGANQIVMSCRGELGPLDVQITKEDNLVQRSSGLDIFVALKALREEAFQIFEYVFLEIVTRSGGAITFKTAAEIATNMAVGIVAPIAEQIDPLKLGAFHRAINIALAYGFRLNDNHEAISHLVRDYPTHSFVIDYKEAQELLGEDFIRLPKQLELTLERLLGLETQEGTGINCLLVPHPENLIRHIVFNIQEDAEGDPDTENPLDEQEDTETLKDNTNTTDHSQEATQEPSLSATDTEETEGLEDHKT